MLYEALDTQLSAFSQTQCPPSSFRCVLSWRHKTCFSLQRFSDEVKNRFDWGWRFWQSVLVQAFFRLFFFFSLAANGKKLGTLVPNQTLFSRSFLFWPSFFALPAPFFLLLSTFIPAWEADEDAYISIRLKLLTKTMKLSLPFCSVIFCHRELSFASSLQIAYRNFVTSPPPRTRTHSHTHSVLLHKCVFFFPLILFAFPFSHICSNFFVVSLTKLFFFLSLAWGLLCTISIQSNVNTLFIFFPILELAGSISK